MTLERYSINRQENAAGVRVAAYDRDADDDLGGGGGPASPTNVKIFDGDWNAKFDGFFACDANLVGGVIVG